MPFVPPNLNKGASALSLSQAVQAAGTKCRKMTYKQQELASHGAALQSLSTWRVKIGRLYKFGLNIETVQKSRKYWRRVRKRA